LGAQAALEGAETRWLTPLPLVMGIVAGPVAWAIDLTSSYALVKWVCDTKHYGVLQFITIASLAAVVGGAVLSWRALARTAHDLPTDGGRPLQRAHFMAILGLAASALFGLQILAGAIPYWTLDACQ
jgi:hypothetical protein